MDMKPRALRARRAGTCHQTKGTNVVALNAMDHPAKNTSHVYLSKYHSGNHFFKHLQPFLCSVTFAFLGSHWQKKIRSFRERDTHQAILASDRKWKTDTIALLHLRKHTLREILKTGEVTLINNVSLHLQVQ